jgi:multiple sugar transport system permease protein/putative aldouronate transport system permease protein
MANVDAPTPTSNIADSAIRAIPATPARSRTRRMAGGFRRNWQLYAMLALPLLWLLVYQYIPMFGAQIAFRDYRPQGGFAGLYEADWVGLEHFRRFFNLPNFWTVLKNTLVLNLYSLIAGFPLPIILALALNYVGKAWFRRSVQLVSYAPHFISVVVIVGMLFLFVARDGVVVQFLEFFGYDGGGLMEKPQYWKSLYVWSGVWQSLGFSAIIYLAALSGIDPTLHEAAIIDGANKLQRMRDIDLPGIMPVAMILLILNMGTLLSTGFEKVLLMQNPLNISTSEVIDTLVYRLAFDSPFPQFALATAVGLFKGVIGLILIVAVNQLARRTKQTSLF